MKKLLTNIEEGIDKVLNVIGIIMFLGVVGITFAQVLTRYVFQTPIASSEELSRIFFIWVSFLGAAMVMRHNEHIRLDVVKEYLGDVGSKILELFIQLLIMLFNVVMVTQGIYLMSITTRQVTSVTRIPMSYIYLIIPLSFGIMIIHGIAIMSRLLWELRNIEKKEHTT